MSAPKDDDKQDIGADMLDEPLNMSRYLTELDIPQDIQAVALLRNEASADRKRFAFRVLAEARLLRLEEAARDQGYTSVRLRDNQGAERFLFVSWRWHQFWYRLVVDIGVFWIDRHEAGLYLADSVPDIMGAAKE